MKVHEARYPLPLSAEEQARLAPAERVAYQRKRDAFDREVEQHKAHIREHGWLDVAPPGWPASRFNVPVVRERPSVTRAEVMQALKGEP